jgi:hypothetical protein
MWPKFTTYKCQLTCCSVTSLKYKDSSSVKTFLYSKAKQKLLLECVSCENKIYKKLVIWICLNY